MPPTPTQRLADLLIPGGLEAFVRSRRAEQRSWRLISRDVWETSGGELDITFETLRTWFPDDEAVSA